MPYVPRILTLTLSRQCNIDCSHCIVEAEPHKGELLNFGLIDQVVGQARSAGIYGVVIYGGEPFLYGSSLLPKTLHRVLAEGFLPAIGTNGFWGRTEDQARKTLSELEQIADEHHNESKMSITVSVDKFHQPKIPTKSIANIIVQHKLGNFPHIDLNIQSFSDEESYQTIGQVAESCNESGIHLIESNDTGYLYPAFQDEFIELNTANLPTICKKLELPTNSPQSDVESFIYMCLSMDADLRDEIKPRIIARRLDLGNGQEANYLVFPDHHNLMSQVIEDAVINAGRYRKDKNSKLQMNLGYENTPDFLVVAPNGQAYAYPAQITAERGVIIGDKPLHQVIAEVGRRRNYSF